MIRRIIAAGAIGGTLALGGAGVASAATTSPATPTHQYNCANAPKALARIAKLEAKAQAWVPKAQAREAAALKAGHTKLANAIAHRISVVEKLEQKGTKREQKIESLCPGATASGASSSASTTSA